jgi:ketosteroid isomerase-like protein
MRKPLIAGLVLALTTGVSIDARGQAPKPCGSADSAAAVAAIRQRLAQWVEQTNRGDGAGANTIWAPPVTGWFPKGAEFSDSAAYAAAGLPSSAGRATVTFQIRVDEVAVGGAVAAVHDIWTETRRFPGSAITVTREIRGSELWRCQSDGAWRIARWVSAPEHWVRSGG